jgi:hypothetical protein
MQIAKFEEPVMRCVDMVVSELLSIIHEATTKVKQDDFYYLKNRISLKMKRFPLLRQATEDLLTQYLRERELATKQACSTYIQTQLSYINTINEDFIGFAGFVFCKGLNEDNPRIKYNREKKIICSVLVRRNQSAPVKPNELLPIRYDTLSKFLYVYLSNEFLGYS